MIASSNKSISLIGCSLLSAFAMSTACSSANSGNGTGVDASTSSGSPDAHSTSGSPDAHSTTGSPDAHSTTGSPDAHSTTGSPDASTTTGSPDAQATSLTGIPLTTPDDSQWLVNMTIGSQQFELSIDTGSSTAAVAGSGCSSCSSAGISPLYSAGNSATDDNNTASSQFADGSGWSGEIYTDTASLGNGTGDVSLNFVSMTDESQFFQDTSTQGILGLGPDGNLLQGTTSYIDGVFANGVASVMSFELCPDGGQMWLGSSFDTSVASSPLVYTTDVGDPNSNPFYAVNLTDLKLGTTSIGASASSYAEPILDTGTTLFYLATTPYNDLVKKVKAESGFSTLFGSQTITTQNQGCMSVASGTTDSDIDAALSPLQFTFPAASGSGNVTVSVPASRSYMLDSGNDEYCFAIQDGGSGQNAIGSIMGDLILSAFLTVIDIGNNQIGLAPDIGCETQNAAHAHSTRHKSRPTEHGNPYRHRDALRAIVAQRAARIGH